MAYIAKTDGTRVPIAVPVTLDAAYKACGTDMVEVVHPRHTPGVIFICDEDGLRKNKPLNRHGCDLYGTITHGHPIVGDIIVFENRREARGWV